MRLIIFILLLLLSACKVEEARNSAHNEAISENSQIATERGREKKANQESTKAIITAVAGGAI